jgi:hypothetical protein
MIDAHAMAILLAILGGVFATTVGCVVAIYVAIDDTRRRKRGLPKGSGVARRG